ALLDPRTVGRTAVLDPAHEQTLALLESDGAPEPARDMRWRDRDAELGTDRSLAAGERLGALACRGVGRDREDQAAVHPDGVEAEQPALRVDERAARRSARERRGVLDGPPDPPAARAAEAAAGGRDEAERRAQAAPAGVRKRDH